MEPRSPPFGAAVELERFVLRDGESHRGQKLASLCVAQREIRKPDLHQSSVRADAGKRHTWVSVPGENELRATSAVFGERLQHVDAITMLQFVDVVEHEHDRLRH